MKLPNVPPSLYLDEVWKGAEMRDSNGFMRRENKKDVVTNLEVLEKMNRFCYN